MDRRTYQAIAAQLDFTRRPGMLFRQLVVDTALVALAIGLLRHGGLGAYTAAQLLWPVIFFRAFSLMHEAVHHNVSRHRGLNDAVGVLGGLLCFMPYESWKRLHLEHHLWSGNIEHDPSTRLRKDYDPKRVWKYRILSAIWRSWIPLMGLLQLVVFWVYPLQQLRRPGYGARTKAMIAVSALLPGAVYAALLLRWPEIFSLANFAPAIFLYLVALEVVNFPHHMDVHAFTGPERLPLAEQWRVTRSSRYPLWLSRTFFLNFNLHTEHHLFPTLPWYQLDKASPLVKAALGSGYNESVGNAWIRKNRKIDLEELLPLRPETSTEDRPPLRKAG